MNMRLPLKSQKILKIILTMIFLCSYSYAKKGVTIKQQDKDAVTKAFKKFSKYFYDPKIQGNISSSKEEEYQALKTRIDKTDKEINQIVYELYGFSEEEIKIVENN